jgi:hypothetical protein
LAETSPPVFATHFTFSWETFLGEMAVSPTVLDWFAILPPNIGQSVADAGCHDEIAMVEASTEVARNLVFMG